MENTNVDEEIILFYMELRYNGATLLNIMNDMDTYHLSRFLTAQDSYSQYKTALEEIRNGRKRSHWMWSFSLN